jgi:uncharacterized repeat protein (TIGR03806 family)
MLHRTRPRHRVTAAGGFVLLLLLSLFLLARPSTGAPPTQRHPGTIRIEGSPDGLGSYVVVEAFPNLTFERPIWVGAPGDGSKNLFVAEQGGRVYVFENDRDVKKKTVALDLSREVLREHNEEGLLGLAFHPDFKNNKQVFVAYSAGDPRRTVVSRFLASGTRKRIRANTEAVLLRQRQPYGNHNGGCLAFGPDENLYVSLGDGGSHGDPQEHAQNLDSWLGSILRLDVSGRKGYKTPPDNPFVGVQHARDEIFAYGLQNPRRFSFDRVTGDLWAADVGNDKWQEINRIESGKNYGWNLREGDAEFKGGRALVPLTDPVLSLGSDQARRITGGFVYRGKRLPGLTGAYVYGDSATGNVWALRLDGEAVGENLLIGRGHGVSSFGEDADGEIYFTCFDGNVHTIASWTGHHPKSQFPRRLSQTGLFTDMQALTPHRSLVPYSVNAPLWSDGAKKQRYVMLPDLEKIKVAKDGSYEFPVGTIFVKTFYVGDEARGPLPGSRLETRLFLRNEREWVGYTYVWDKEQQDAHLLDGRLERPRLVAPEPGQSAVWTFPSRSDCMSCHTEVGGRVLGFTAAQLDRKQDYGGETANQLDVFERLGLFEGKAAQKVKAWPDLATAPVDDVTAARAYLHSNCAMCHQPQGPGNASIDLRFGTNVEDMGLVDQVPGQWNLGVYKGKLVVPGEPERSLLYVRMQMTDAKGMPPLAHNVQDAKGLERIAAWIRKLKD